MKWIKIEAGEYYSEDNKFQILHVWDRIYGLHWSLLDKSTQKSHEGESLKHCKDIAEKIKEGVIL